MASAHLAMEVMEDGSGKHKDQDDQGPLIKYYRVSELIPSPKHPMHTLMKKEPAVWAAVQISSGVLSVVLGVIFAVSFKINDYFLTLFRVPIVSGILFLVSGILSTLLYSKPALLQMCFHSNIFCLSMACIGAVLLSVDLGGGLTSDLRHQVEILVLCVTLLDILVSIVLIALIHAEKRRREKK